MSEAHYTPATIADLQIETAIRENENAEREMAIARLEAENKAFQDNLDRNEREALRRARQQDRVNDQLSEKLKETRRQNARQILQVRAEFGKDLQKINQNTRDQIQNLRNQTNKNIGELRMETRSIYAAHKKATDERFKLVNKDIANLKGNIISIQNDIELIKQDKVQIKEYTINLIKDLQIIINDEMKDERSPFLKKETAPGNVTTKLQHYKSELDSIIRDFNSGQSAEVILQKAGTLYSHFSNDQFVALERERDVNERYRTLIAEYEGLLSYVSNNKLVKIKRQKPENPLFDILENNWKELETEDWEIDIDYWSKGSYQAFLEDHTKKLEVLKQEGYSQAHFVDKDFLDRMENRIQEVQTEYVRITSKARSFAVNSNIREVMAHKMIKKLENLGVSDVKISFEKEDKRSRLHINAMVRGENRHFILGADNDNAEALNTTFLQGDDHHKVSADTFRQTTNDLIEQLNSGQIGINLKSDGGSSVIETGLCSEVKSFENGMTDEALIKVGQKQK